MLQWTDLAVRVMTTERVSGLFVVAPFSCWAPRARGSRSGPAI